MFQQNSHPLDTNHAKCALESTGSRDGGSLSQGGRTSSPRAPRDVCTILSRASHPVDKRRWHMLQVLGLSSHFRKENRATFCWINVHVDCQDWQASSPKIEWGSGQTHTFSPRGFQLLVEQINFCFWLNRVWEKATECCNEARDLQHLSGTTEHVLYQGLKHTSPHWRPQFGYSNMVDPAVRIWRTQCTCNVWCKTNSIAFCMQSTLVVIPTTFNEYKKWMAWHRPKCVKMGHKNHNYGYITARYSYPGHEMLCGDFKNFWPFL